MSCLSTLVQEVVSFLLKEATWLAVALHSRLSTIPLAENPVCLLLTLLDFIWMRLLKGEAQKTGTAEAFLPQRERRRAVPHSQSLSEETSACLTGPEAFA